MANQRGRLGEQIASRYLKQKGYEILETNFVFRIFSGLQKAEIDIIAKKNKVFIFVEVKTILKRFEQSTFLPESKVNFKKKQKISKASQFWLMKNKLPLNSPSQIDVIVIELNGGANTASVRQIENV